MVILRKSQWKSQKSETVHGNSSEIPGEKCENGAPQARPQQGKCKNGAPQARPKAKIEKRARRARFFHKNMFWAPQNIPLRAPRARFPTKNVFWAPKNIHFFCILFVFFCIFVCVLFVFLFVFCLYF